MWDPVWPALLAERDAARLDLRGYGESSARPSGALSPVEDVLDTLAALEIGRCHLVGASLGAGVAVEVALTRPDAVESLVLGPSAGSLLAELTPDLRAFSEAERAALAHGDLDGAVEANLARWVDGPPQRSIWMRSTTRPAAWSTGSPTRASSSGRIPSTFRRWNAPPSSSRFCATGWHRSSRRRVAKPDELRELGLVTKRPRWPG